MNPELYHQVIKYYQNQLSYEERTQFEQKFRTDETFATTVKSYVQMYELIQQYGDHELNSNLTELGKKLMKTQPVADLVDSPAPKPRLPFTHFYKSAYFYYTTAAIILVLILIFSFFRNTTRFSSDNIYEIYFSAQNIKIYRSENQSNQSIDIIWKSAALAYGNQNYEKAALLFETIINDSSRLYRSDAWLFLGITRMEQNRFPEAIAAFEHVSPGSTVTEDAQWYMALSYLKMNQLSKAKALFTAIAQAKISVNRSEDAAKILKIFPPVE